MLGHYASNRLIECLIRFSGMAWWRAQSLDVFAAEAEITISTYYYYYCEQRQKKLLREIRRKTSRE